ncbi:unnamed protein product [Cylicocyclus nassatus]|uniref:HMG box domain-containing protein n=1 Tax=Cylicocyclus nassatus TaxID=53992 RepID=A0AA36H382_CYLNA|nr:unnamed protein product [Cylicocyclus nassatus]
MLQSNFLSMSARFLASAKAMSRGKQVKYPVTGMSMNPLAIYVKEHFAKNSAKSIEEGQKAMKEVVASWKALNSAEKKKYEELSKKYREEKMHEFDALSDEEKQERISASLEEKEERAKRRARKERKEDWEKTGHPERPPSAYNLFVQEKFTDLKNKGEVVTPVVKTMQRLSAEWKGMSDSAKQPYLTKATRLANHYKAEVEAWKAKVKPEKGEPQKFSNSGIDYGDQLKELKCVCAIVYAFTTCFTILQQLYIGHLRTRDCLVISLEKRM